MFLAKKSLAFLFSGLLFSGVTFAGEEEVQQFVDGTVRVSAEEVIDLVGANPNLVILDTRKASDFQKGFIEGAISLPNTDTNAASLAKHVPSKSTPILLYCNGSKCGRSAKSAQIALAEGYNKIYWFRGGMEEWEAKGLPVVHP